jgi:hypothetical protein
MQKPNGETFIRQTVSESTSILDVKVNDLTQ